MSDPTTPFLGLVKPVVNDEAGEDLWGDKLNGNFDKLDTDAHSNATAITAIQTGKVGEAPLDGKPYGRKDAAWYDVSTLPVSWTSVTGKPSTFPPELPIPQVGITGLIADQATQNSQISANTTAINGKEPSIAPGTVNDFWRGDKVWVPLSTITVDAYTKAQADARFEPIDTMYTKAESDIRYELKITAGTTAQYWRGDKSWQTLDKTAVGLGNVDNTSDANKPLSTADVAALAGKEPTISAGTTAQYWRGDKTWVAFPAVPAAGTYVPQTGATGAANLPTGTTAQRPSPVTGQMRFNSDLTIFEGYNGTSWAGIGGGVAISDTPPASPRPGDLWWESDSGGFFLRYNDGNSQQWVQVNAKGLNDAPSDNTLYGRVNGVWQSGGRMTGPLTVLGSAPSPAPQAAVALAGTLVTSTNLGLNLYPDAGNNWDRVVAGYGGIFQCNPANGLFNWYSGSNGAAGASAALTGLMTLGPTGALTIPSGLIDCTLPAGTGSGTYAITGKGAGSGGGVLGYNAGNTTYGILGLGSYSFQGSGAFLNTGAGQFTSALTIGGALSFTNITNFQVGYNNGANVTSGTSIFEVMFSGGAYHRWASNYVAPVPDNAVYCGLSAQRYYAVYAVTGTIQTSDEREKQDIRPLDEREKAAAQRIKGLIVAYRWKDRVANGKDERIYIGVIAQRIEEALAAEGLDAASYAMWTKDWLEEWVEPVLDEEGRIVEEGHMRQTGEYRYSVDYSQVLAFIIGGM